MKHWLLLLVSVLVSCQARVQAQTEAGVPTTGLFEKSELPELGAQGIARLTLLATNDIHGGVEPSR